MPAPEGFPQPPMGQNRPGPISLDFSNAKEHATKAVQDSSTQLLAALRESGLTGDLSAIQRQQQEWSTQFLEAVGKQVYAPLGGISTIEQAKQARANAEILQRQVDDHVQGFAKSIEQQVPALREETVLNPAQAAKKEKLQQALQKFRDDAVKAQREVFQRAIDKAEEIHRLHLLKMCQELAPKIAKGSSKWEVLKAHMTPSRAPSLKDDKWGKLLNKEDDEDSLIIYQHPNRDDQEAWPEDIDIDRNFSLPTLNFTLPTHYDEDDKTAKAYIYCPDGGIFGARTQTVSYGQNSTTGRSGYKFNNLYWSTKAQRMTRMLYSFAALRVAKPPLTSIKLDECARGGKPLSLAEQIEIYIVAKAVGIQVLDEERLRNEAGDDCDRIDSEIIKYQKKWTGAADDAKKEALQVTSQNKLSSYDSSLHDITKFKGETPERQKSIFLSASDTERRQLIQELLKDDTNALLVQTLLKHAYAADNRGARAIQSLIQPDPTMTAEPLAFFKVKESAIPQKTAENYATFVQALGPQGYLLTDRKLYLFRHGKLTEMPLAVGKEMQDLKAAVGLPAAADFPAGQPVLITERLETEHSLLTTFLPANALRYLAGDIHAQQMGVLNALDEGTLRSVTEFSLRANGSYVERAVLLNGFSLLTETNQGFVLDAAKNTNITYYARFLEKLPIEKLKDKIDALLVPGEKKTALQYLSADALAQLYLHSLKGVAAGARIAADWKFLNDYFFLGSNKLTPEINQQIQRLLLALPTSDAVALMNNLKQHTDATHIIQFSSNLFTWLWKFLRNILAPTNFKNPQGEEQAPSFKQTLQRNILAAKFYGHRVKDISFLEMLKNRASNNNEDLELDAFQHTTLPHHPLTKYFEFIFYFEKKLLDLSATGEPTTDPARTEYNTAMQKLAGYFYFLIENTNNTELATLLKLPADATKQQIQLAILEALDPKIAAKLLLATVGAQLAADKKYSYAVYKPKADGNTGAVLTSPITDNEHRRHIPFGKLTPERQCHILNTLLLSTAQAERDYAKATLFDGLTVAQQSLLLARLPTDLAVAGAGAGRAPLADQLPGWLATAVTAVPASRDRSVAIAGLGRSFDKLDQPTLNSPQIRQAATDIHTSLQTQDNLSMLARLIPHHFADQTAANWADFMGLAKLYSRTYRPPAAAPAAAAGGAGAAAAPAAALPDVNANVTTLFKQLWAQHEHGVLTPVEKASAALRQLFSHAADLFPVPGAPVPAPDVLLREAQTHILVQLATEVGNGVYTNAGLVKELIRNYPINTQPERDNLIATLSTQPLRQHICTILLSEPCSYADAERAAWIYNRMSNDEKEQYRHIIHANTSMMANLAIGLVSLHSSKNLLQRANLLENRLQALKDSIPTDQLINFLNELHKHCKTTNVFPPDIAKQTLKLVASDFSTRHSDNFVTSFAACHSETQFAIAEYLTPAQRQNVLETFKSIETSDHSPAHAAIIFSLLNSANLGVVNSQNYLQTLYGNNVVEKVDDGVWNKSRYVASYIPVVKALFKDATITQKSPMLTLAYKHLLTHLASAKPPQASANTLQLLNSWDSANPLFQHFLGAVCAIRSDLFNNLPFTLDLLKAVHAVYNRGGAPDENKKAYQLFLRNLLGDGAQAANPLSYPDATKLHNFLKKRIEQTPVNQLKQEIGFLADSYIAKETNSQCFSPQQIAEALNALGQKGPEGIDLARQMYTQIPESTREFRAAVLQFVKPDYQESLDADLVRNMRPPAPGR